DLFVSSSTVVRTSFVSTLISPCITVQNSSSYDSFQPSNDSWQKAQSVLDTIPMEAVSPVSRAYSSASQKYSSVALAPSSVFSVATAGKLGSGTFWAGPSADAGMYSVGSTSDASVVSSS